MIDPRVQTWANVLASYSVSVQPGDRVAIMGDPAATPLLRAVYRAVLERGGHPVVIGSLTGQQADLLRYGSDEQVAWIDPLERFARAEADCLIRVAAETNTRAAGEVDPARSALHRRARADLSNEFMARAARGDVRWSSTLWPTDAYAQDAGMSTEAFTEFIFDACKLNAPDPVAAWVALHDMQAQLIERLTPAREVHIVAPETDLRMSVAGRTWINSDGKRNFPSGEVFTGPVEDSAEGHIRFSYPVVTGGREVGGIRLRFAAGRVVDASAETGEDYLLQMLAADEGASRLGEMAFGTNRDITRFTRQILLDEKIGGTIHMALGAGYPDSGSSNRSAIHWDMICDLRGGGRVDLDGEPFVVDGEFVGIGG